MAFHPFVHNLGDPKIREEYFATHPMTPELQADLERLPDIKYRQFDTPERKHAFHELFEQMEEIAADSSGSDPADYLSPEDAATCARIVEIANREGWPNATPLEMRRPYKPLGAMGLHAWKHPPHITKSNAAKLFKFPQVDLHKGYIFGHLSVGPAQISQAVVLCEDGRLRSHRGPELIHGSKGIGWGRLPDAELVKKVLARGQMYPIQYVNVNHQTLSEIFEERSGGVIKDPGPPVSPPAPARAA